MSAELDDDVESSYTRIKQFLESSIPTTFLKNSGNLSNFVSARVVCTINVQCGGNDCRAIHMQGKQPLLALRTQTIKPQGLPEERHQNSQW